MKKGEEEQQQQQQQALPEQQQCEQGPYLYQQQQAPLQQPSLEQQQSWQQQEQQHQQQQQVLQLQPGKDLGEDESLIERDSRLADSGAGDVVGRGEEYFVLRLSPSAAAQLWNPLTGEALNLSSSSQANPPGSSFPQQHQQQQQLLLEQLQLWSEELEVLAALRVSNAETKELQQRLAAALPVAEAFAASQHRSLQELQHEQRQQQWLGQAAVDEQQGGEAAVKEVLLVESGLVEVQKKTNLLLQRWQQLHAAAEPYSPFLLGGRQQQNREGIFPVSSLSLLVGMQNVYINLQPMWCLNSWEVPASAAPGAAAAGAGEGSGRAFTPELAAEGTAEEEAIRRSVQEELQRKHKRRCFGLPTLFAAAKHFLKTSNTSGTWIQLSLRCLSFVWRRRPGLPCTLSSCKFDLNNRKHWSPLLPEPILLPEDQRREAATAYETTFVSAGGLQPEGAAPAAAAAAAQSAAKVLGVTGEDAKRAALLPPTGWAKPLPQEVEFTEADVRRALELEQQLQTALQQLIRNRYSNGNIRSGMSGSVCVESEADADGPVAAWRPAASSWRAEGLGGEGYLNEEVTQCIAFAEEPVAGVYEVLGLYEEVRRTSTWHSLAFSSPVSTETEDREMLIMQQQTSTSNAHACNTPVLLTGKQYLEEALLAVVSSAFPGRQLQGIVFHFNELNTHKLLDRLLHAQVFGALPLRYPGQNIARVYSRVGCLVVRLFAFPCGLYSGWLFAGTID
ncbi:hypothetical protein EPH_0007250 [Eimeria praecox]|uniref:Uncharacterized protein n=1 Tax=Eimeria praecox TaxID=51316 RepID=U6G989_9EIME|nr:hypothetical protein EPH_0007250 [Eimeria praecox]